MSSRNFNKRIRATALQIPEGLARRAAKVARNTSTISSHKHLWDGARVAAEIYSSVDRFVAESQPEDGSKLQRGLIQQIVRDEVQRRKRKYLKQAKLARQEALIPATEDNAIEIAAASAVEVMPNDSVVSLIMEMSGTKDSQGSVAEEELSVTSRSRPQIQNALTPTPTLTLQNADPSSSRAVEYGLDSSESHQLALYAQSGHRPHPINPEEIGMEVDHQNATIQLIPWTEDLSGDDMNAEASRIDFDHPMRPISFRVSPTGSTQMDDQDDDLQVGDPSSIAAPFANYASGGNTDTEFPLINLEQEISAETGNVRSVGLETENVRATQRPPRRNTRVDRKGKGRAIDSPRSHTTATDCGNGSQRAQSLQGPSVEYRMTRQQRAHPVPDQETGSEVGRDGMEVEEGTKEALMAHTSLSHRPTIHPRLGDDSQSRSNEILHRISNQLEELRENQKELSAGFEKLEEKVDSLEQQSIASRSATVEKHASRPRTRRSVARAGQFIIPKPKTRRGDDRNEFLVANIRLFMNPKLGIRRDKDIIALDLSRFPSPQDAKRLMEQNNRPPEDHLPVCWEDLHCSWNERLSGHFLASFIAQYPIYVDQNEEILDHFWQRLDRLKSLRKRTSRRDGESEDQCNSRRYKMLSTEQTRLRKRSRQDQLFVDRLRVASENANHHPNLGQRKEWALTAAVLERLGVSGMSSDESEDPDDNMPERRYTIKARVWRSRKIRDLMARTDQELRKTKRSLYGNAPPGNPPRIRQRVKTPASSQRAAVGQLPINFYSKEWLRNLSPAARGHLSPGDSLELPNVLTRQT
ncbi:hypothetical protein V5O48_003101 [Marasmius crinis-equi]|uniref:Uncharacterized protein n=1 Tax=Marasmius crinis-equi TaxID=585013 RepID=A0ABR3FUV5_9AGAR